MKRITRKIVGERPPRTWDNTFGPLVYWQVEAHVCFARARLGKLGGMPQDEVNEAYRSAYVAVLMREYVKTYVREYNKDVC